MVTNVLPFQHLCGTIWMLFSHCLMADSGPSLFRFSSVLNSIYVFGKTHNMPSARSLGSFPSVAFETVLTLVFFF